MADLQRHECIVHTRFATGNCWHFAGEQGPVAAEVSGRYRADNLEAVLEAVLAGIGIAVIPAFAFAGEIERGEVEVLLEALEPKPMPLHAVHPSRKYVPLRARAMIDFLTHEFDIDPITSGYGARVSGR